MYRQKDGLLQTAVINFLLMANVSSGGLLHQILVGRKLILSI